MNHLKQWADPWYNQPGEVKGGQVALSYNKLIVTSNYNINTIDINEVDRDALKDRFE